MRRRIMNRLMDRSDRRSALLAAAGSLALLGGSALAQPGAGDFQPARACAPVQEATVPIQSVVGKGRASTREKAVLLALREAVRQVNGASLTANSAYKETFERFLTNTETINDIKVDSQDEWDIKSDGIIHAYRVRDEVKEGNDFIVEACVDVMVYRPSWRPGPPTLGVIPFDSRGSNGPGLSGKQLSDAAVAEMNGSFVREGRFRVVDRSTMDRVFEEQARIRDWVASGQAQAAEAITLGNLLGADYLLIMQLHDLNASRERVYNSVLRADETQRSMSVTMSAKIVSTGTGELIWASPLLSRAFGSREIVQGVGWAAYENDDEFVTMWGLRQVMAELTGDAHSFLDARYAQPPYVYFADGDYVEIDLNQNPYRPGDRLRIVQVRTSSSGRSATVPIATVEIIAILEEGGRAEVRIIDRRSESATIVEDLVCEPLSGGR